MGSDGRRGLLRLSLTRGALALFFLWAAALSQAEDIRVAVAANFAGAIQAMAPGFEAQTGHRLLLSFGSSGKFFAQIQQGAPFQVFLSADQAKPAALEQAGLTVSGNRFTYALGALALWSARAEVETPNYERLQAGDFNKLALANPRLAPYGAAAVAVLERLQLRQATESRWVMGENIAQTYQFVASGNAELGFVALSQLRANEHSGKGSHWVVPADHYPPIRQDAVLLQRAAHSVGAKALLDYLRSDTARAIMATYGYQTE